MINYHSLIPWGSFRGRFGDHFRAGDPLRVGIISGAVNTRHVPELARVYDVRMAEFVPKNRKIAPYHGPARNPRLTVYVPDSGSCV